jgi:hypothetical protein
MDRPPAVKSGSTRISQSLAPGTYANDAMILRLGRRDRLHLNQALGGITIYARTA